MTRLGIALTGGGARAAYQVGALRALYEIMQEDKDLFHVITGNSAGAINAVYLAAHAHSWDVATGQLWDLWKDIHPQNVFDLGALTIGKLGGKWLSGTVLGGLKSKGNMANHLLDTSPLRQLIEKEIDFKSLNAAIKSGKPQAFAVSTTNLYSGSSVVFHNNQNPIEEWARSDRFSTEAEITSDHIMASSAIPLFFPPVQIGDSWFADGCVRQTTPLSPAIHLGADKIIAIGIRAPHTQEAMREKAFAKNRNPAIGQIAGVLMNAVFLDALESDVERLSRINHTIYNIDKQKREELYKNLRPVPILMLRPSQDLGMMTAQLSKELPTILRYLLKGIGVSGDEGLDLLSYLAFDKSYSRPLMALGHSDTLARSEEIKKFIEL
ncbi:MAG: patatin-like phospholipase family protein [Bacteriovoracaceae bacterium]|nr:patatin-like phospholipase family protein [Bacteriovoracaceae bacterium]